MDHFVYWFVCVFLFQCVSISWMPWPSQRQLALMIIHPQITLLQGLTYKYMCINYNKLVDEGIRMVNPFISQHNSTICFFDKHHLLEERKSRSESWLNCYNHSIWTIATGDGIWRLTAVPQLEHEKRSPTIEKLVGIYDGLLQPVGVTTIFFETQHLEKDNNLIPDIIIVIAIHY